MLAGPLSAAEPLGASEESVVVLRNGQVLKGQVERIGDLYLVSLAAGAKVHLPAADVDLHCPTLDDAYQKKRAYVPADNARQHLDLAEWCLRQGLKRSAAEQLSAALAADPNEPRIAPFEQRLRESLTATPVAKTTSNVSMPARVDDLEAVMRGVPALALERFTSNVQPLLLNRCSTSSCHGTTSKSSFKLLRPAAGDTITRRYTQRNLHAVLQIIDRAAPEASPLLTSPRGVHGTTNTPVFGQREERQYEQLVQWVKLTVERPDARRVANVNVDAAEPRLLQVADAHAMRTYLKPPLADKEPLNESKPQPGPSSKGNSKAKQASGTKPSPPAPFCPPAAPKPLQPDPFDPEIFNRRFQNEND